MATDLKNSVLVYDVGGSHVSAAVCLSSAHRLGPVINAPHPAEQTSDAFVGLIYCLALLWWDLLRRGLMIRMALTPLPQIPPRSSMPMQFRVVIGGMCLVFCSFIGMAQQNPSCHGPQPLELEVRNHPSAKNWGALGGWFGERRQFACAIPTFQAALGIEPGSASLHYYLGLSLNSSGRSEAAVAELQRSIELDQNQLQPRLLLGVVFNQLNRPAEAEEAWEAALRVDPNSVTALDWLAKARISDGQFSAAIDLLSTAQRDEDLTLDLALAYSQANRFDKATETLTAALVTTPGELRLSAALATVYVQSHRYQDATNLLRDTVKSHPSDPATELLYLRVLVLQDDDATARPLARKFLAANPDSFDALYLTGILETDAQEYDSAVEHLKAAIALNPSHYDARYNLGVALSRLQRSDAAREQLEKAVTLDPTQGEAHFHLAQVLRSLGKTEEAQAELKLFKERQEATVKLALGQTKAGQAAQALKDGRADQAIALYREAIEAQPQNASFENDLAKALDLAGDKAQERIALEKAIQLNPGFAAAENLLGNLTAETGETAAAELHFRNALAAMPRYAEASNNLGTLLGQLGRDTEAEVRFRSAVSSNPRFTLAWVNLAATLASQSRFPEARAAVESALKVDPTDADALRLRKMLANSPGDGSSSTKPPAVPGLSDSKIPH